MIGKNSKKFYYLKSKIFTVTYMEHITNADYGHAKRVCKDLKKRNLRDNRDLYVQSNTLLLVDVFENFRNMFLKIYVVDPAHFFPAPGLVWQTALKKNKVKLDLLNDFDVLSLVGKGIRGGICHVIYRYVKGNNRYMKNYDKNKEP